MCFALNGLLQLKRTMHSPCKVATVRDGDYLDDDAFFSMV